MVMLNQRFNKSPEDSRDNKKQKDREVLEKYMKAGKILADVREEAVRKVTIGASLLEVAEYIENLIREKGGQPAFPVNISRNDEAAHATPTLNDKTVFKEDMVKLDIGVHIDGYIADTAVTVNLSGDNSQLVKAAEAGLKAAIETIRGGINTSEIGAAIEDAIKEYGYKPVGNLTGHGLARYIQHAPPSIPNTRVSRGIDLKAGDIIAIEPFATNGVGRVYDAGNAEIYHIVVIKPVRLPSARSLLKEIEAYKTLPFAKRWLGKQETSGNIDFALIQLVKAGIVKPYPILKEVNRGLVSQAEDTILVTEDGCKVLTR